MGQALGGGFGNGSVSQKWDQPPKGECQLPASWATLLGKEAVTAVKWFCHLAYNKPLPKGCYNFEIWEIYHWERNFTSWTPHSA